MAAVDEYQQRTRQSVFVEYVMLGPGESAAAICTCTTSCSRRSLTRSSNRTLCSYTQHLTLRRHAAAPLAALQT